ncbi:MAG TPA: prepilin-type N-terminal cleavage/methylation domain-containing protein [Syntrophorhabdaceae bacterium]|nr:prepilin-type N-terminal cleavage/methylation domain-containing protein [Syntrophorhabdaceae bacterium]
MQKSLGCTRAFTLLEIIIVLVLVAVIFGLAALSFTNALPSARLSAAARELSASIRQTKSLAQNRGEQQIFTINLDTRQYGIEGVTARTIPPEISIMVDDPISGEIHSGRYSILFQAGAGVEGGTVVLGYKKRTFLIQIDPVVGAVIVRR